MDLDVVRKVARIARLELTDEELEEFSVDLAEILEYLSILDKAPTTSGYGFNPVPIEDILREDEESIDIDPEMLRDMMDIYEELVRGPRLS